MVDELDWVFVVVVDVVEQLFDEMWLVVCYWVVVIVVDLFDVVQFVVVGQFGEDCLVC